MKKGKIDAQRVFWEELKKRQLRLDEKPFLSGYMVLSNKQVDEIEKELEKEK